MTPQRVLLRRLALVLPLELAGRRVDRDDLIGFVGEDDQIARGKYSPGEFHYRFVQGEYDVCEMSAATFLRTKEKGRRFVEAVVERMVALIREFRAREIARRVDHH